MAGQHLRKRCPVAACHHGQEALRLRGQARGARVGPRSHRHRAITIASPWCPLRALTSAVLENAMASTWPSISADRSTSQLPGKHPCDVCKRAEGTGRCSVGLPVSVRASYPGHPLTQPQGSCCTASYLVGIHARGTGPCTLQSFQEARHHTGLRQAACARAHVHAGVLVCAHMRMRMYVEGCVGARGGCQAACKPEAQGGDAGHVALQCGWPARHCGCGRTCFKHSTSRPRTCHERHWTQDVRAVRLPQLHQLSHKPLCAGLCAGKGKALT